MDHVIPFAVLVVCLFSGTAVCRSLNDAPPDSGNTTQRDDKMMNPPVNVDEDELAIPYHGVFCDKALDLMLIMDASTTIGEDRFRKVKRFMIRLVKNFEVSPDLARVGAIRYNKYGWRDFDLNTYSWNGQVRRALRRLSGVAVGSRTGHALKVAKNQAFTSENGDREGVPNVVVLITDGRSTYPEWSEQEANLLKDTGAKIFVIGMGGRIDVDELNFISSGPSYTYVVKDGDRLRPILRALTEAVCEEASPKPIPDPDCEICTLADVALVMDASSSIGPNNLELLKTFFQGLVKHFDIGEGRVNVALVKYNKLGQKVFSLNEYKSRKDVNEAIAAVSGTAVGTRTGHAMKVVRNEVFVEKNGDRADAPNVVLLVTDGRSTYPEWTFEQAQLLKDADTSIFAIGIGGRIDADELRQTASSPDSVYVHYVNDFHGLDEILNAFAKIFCEDLTTPPPTPPTTTTPEVCALGDVALVMDASSSIGPSNLERLKTFLQNLVENFDIDEGRVNVALVKYNKLGQQVFSLNKYNSQKDINDAIAAVNGTAVGTRTGHAMKVVRNEVFVENNGDRADAPNVVLLVTDGRSTYPEWTFEQAQLLKDAGVRIFAIGIGGRIDADELRQTASSPDSVYVHYVDDFHGLDDILNEFVPVFCTGSARR